MKLDKTIAVIEITEQLLSLTKESTYFINLPLGQWGQSRTSIKSEINIYDFHAVAPKFGIRAYVSDVCFVPCYEK